jgi:hypothetical protein
MKNKLNLMIMILAMLVFGNTLMGQKQTEKTKIVPPDDRVIDAVKPDDDLKEKVPVLGCCQCLGGTNSLNLSTIAGNNWRVAGSPAAFITTPHSAWNLPTSGASWVSTVASGASTNLPISTLDYELKFKVQNCTIPQTVTLTGKVGGDDDIAVYLDNTSGTALSSCTGGWCFNTSNPPPAISTTVGAGWHKLIVRVNNGGVSPSGMFVNAKLTSNCSKSPTKPEKEQ